VQASISNCRKPESSNNRIKRKRINHEIAANENPDGMVCSVKEDGSLVRARQPIDDCAIRLRRVATALGRATSTPNLVDSIYFVESFRRDVFIV
jgi:hypothetical protein